MNRRPSLCAPDRGSTIYSDFNTCSARQLRQIKNRTQTNYHHTIRRQIITPETIVDEELDSRMTQKTNSSNSMHFRPVGKCSRRLLQLLLITSSTSTSNAFTGPIFQEAAPLQRTTPSKTSGVEIELPDFEKFFGRLQEVSPLAKLAFSGGGAGVGGGFAAIEDTSKSMWHITLFHIDYVRQSNTFSIWNSSRGIQVEESGEEQKKDSPPNRQVR